MSYCVNCGVELDKTAQKCPLCNTIVINPNEISTSTAPMTKPFPNERGTVESINRKDFGILLTVFVVATSVICGIVNRFIFSHIQWSLAVMGICVILWVTMIPVAIYNKQTRYVSLILDGMAVIFYLYMMKIITHTNDWFWGLGVPIVILVVILLELFTFVSYNFAKSFLKSALYFITFVALLCLGLEIMIDSYIHEEISLVWSIIVLTICAILDIVIITMLSRRRVRNEIQRRLHF